MSRPLRSKRGAALVAAALVLVGAFATLQAAPAGAQATGVTLASSANPSAYGAPVSLQAVVEDPTTPLAAQIGTMTFRDGTVVLATKKVQRGKATLTTSKLVPGDHPLTATYSPTGGSAVTSAPLVQHVARGATTTSVASSKPTYYVGQSGNLTATVKAVAPAPGVPTGAVDFAADGYPLATVPLSSTGRATLPLSTLSPGTSSITATYSGSDAYDPSTTPVPLDQTVLVNVPVAGATFTPTTVAPGGTARLVLSATNVGPTALTSNVALGALVPMPFRIVSMPPGQLCGVRRGLVYCLTSVPKGGTSRLVLDVTGPPTPGTYTVSAYARNIDTGDETYATATLTVA